MPIYLLNPVKLQWGDEKNHKCCYGYGENDTLIHWEHQCKLVQSLWKSVQRIFKELETDLPHGLANLFLDVCGDIYYLQYNKSN